MQENRNRPEKHADRGRKVAGAGSGGAAASSVGTAAAAPKKGSAAPKKQLSSAQFFLLHDFPTKSIHGPHHGRDRVEPALAAAPHHAGAQPGLLPASSLGQQLYHSRRR